MYPLPSRSRNKALEGELADQLAGWRELTAARLALSQRHFTAASKRARAALVDEAQTLDERVKIAAAVTLCVAVASSDGDGIGPARCAEASNQASELGDLVLLADVLLAQDEARLASGDMSGAIPLAEDALRRSIALGRGPASWQATAVLAVANASIGNTQAARELSSQGDGVLDSLREQWGDAALDGYLSRPDVRYLRERVTRAVSTND